MNKDIPLSKNLEKQLRQVRNRYLYVFYLTSFAKLVVIFITSYLIFYISDRLWETPPILRGIFIVATCLYAFTVIVHLLKVRNLFKKDYMAIIKVLQNHFEEIGDSLQGAVELSLGQHRPSNISEELCRAAIEQVNEKVSHYKFTKGVKYAKFLQVSSIVLFVASCFGGLFKLEKEAFYTSLERWINPLSKSSRYLFTQFDLQTKQLIVIRGEKSKFNIKVKEKSYFQPDHFNYKLRSSWQKENFLIMEDGETLYKQLELPAMTKVIDLKIKQGDFKGIVKIIPKERPQLLDLKVAIDYPSYLGIKSLEKTLYSSKISVLPDTKISFVGGLNKKIKTFDWTKNDEALTEKVIFDNKTFKTPYLLFNEGDKISFAWIDVDGLTANKTYEYTIIFEEDSDPVVSIAGISSDFTMLPEDIVEITISAKDDFGLQEIGYEWIIKDDRGNEIKKFSQVLEKGGKQLKILQTEVIFSPVIEGIPESNDIFIRAFTRDYKPHSEKIYSSEHKLYVLSLGEHLEIVNAKFNKILQRIKSLVQTEQNNIQRTMGVEIYSDDKLVLKEVDQELLTIAQFENDTYQTLNNLIENGKKVVKEASQNNLFKNEVIYSWKSAFAILNNLANNQVTKAKQTLEQAGIERKVKERREIIDDAKQLQEEVLRELEDLSGKYADINRDSAINTFATRFRNDSKNAKKISEKLRTFFLKTAGLNINDFSEIDKKSHNNILEEQNKINADIKSIEQELFTLFTQSQRQKYKDVYEKMIASDVRNHLDSLEEDIRKNKTHSSILPIQKWGKTFLEWAELLVPKPKENEEVTDENDSKEIDTPEDEQQKADNDLIVVIQRLADEEEKIYKLTKNLTKWNRNQRYNKKLNLIKDRQKRNARKTTEISEMKEIEKDVKNALGTINSLMGQAYKSLDEKGAEQEALNFEASSLELLLALIQEKEGEDGNGDGKSGDGKPSEKKGKKGGDSPSDGKSGGGGGDGKSEEVADSEELDNKNKFDSRLKKILKGNSTAEILNNSPIEYHKALEAYYRELEKQ